MLAVRTFDKDGIAGVSMFVEQPIEDRLDACPVIDEAQQTLAIWSGVLEDITRHNHIKTAALRSDLVAVGSEACFNLFAKGSLKDKESSLLLVGAGKVDVIVAS